MLGNTCLIRIDIPLLYQLSWNTLLCRVCFDVGAEDEWCYPLEIVFYHNEFPCMEYPGWINKVNEGGEII